MNLGKDLPLILVIDEVEPLVRLIELELGFQGLRVDCVLINDDPVAKALEVKPDAIVVGAVIPTPQLYDLLGRLRASVPAKLLFVNGAANESDSALALQMGADDTITRPFLPEQLGLHLRNLLSLDVEESATIRRGNLTIDHLRRIVWKGDMKLALGTNEWGLLLAMASARRPLNETELLTTVWGDEYVNESQFLKLWIDRLRVNLGDDPGNPKIVLGDLREGYRLAD